MTVLTAIRDRFAVRKDDAESQYAKLVSASSKGGDIDLNGLDEVLSLTGRAMEDFVCDVERIERRAAARLKLSQAEKLKAASKESLAASHAVDEAREKTRKLVDSALETLREKSDVAGSLSRQIRELEMTAHEDLMATADPALQAEIDQLEVQASNIRERQNTVGRGAGCDAAEASAEHQRANFSIAKLEEQIEELRAQQLASKSLVMLASDHVQSSI